MLVQTKTAGGKLWDNSVCAAIYGKLLDGGISENSMILTKNTEIRFDYNSLKVIGFKNIYWRNSLVFELSMKNSKNVFMRSDCGFRDNQEYILILDLKKLCASTKFKKILDKRVVFDNPESASPYIKTKILNCLDGFSQGISNPVPLAEISYCLDEVRFINGITRMSYLVSFCDSSIPIKCDIDSVEKLFSLFGDKNYEPRSLEEYRMEYENKMN